LRQWASLNSGIRVYLEGFRVLPYGEVGNDWLRLDQDVTRRGGRFELDPLLSGLGDQLDAMRSLKQREYVLRLMPFRNFFGAVFLTEEGGRFLRTLVNREGFVPDRHFETLVSLVRRGTDLVQRARALASFQLSQQAAAQAEAEKAARRSRGQRQQNNSSIGQRPADEELGNSKPDSAAGNSNENAPGASGTADDRDNQNSEDSAEEETLELDERSGRSRGSGARLLAAIDELREILQAESGSNEITGPVADALDEVESAAIHLLEDTSLLRVLASVGSQLAAFNHEAAHLLPTARAAEAALSPQQGQRWSAEAVRARKAVADLVRSLERQSAYLVDVVSTDARRRRRRLPLRDSVDLAARTVLGTAAAADITMVNEVPDDLRAPPMFQAELLAVLTNLLTNAVKAAGQGGIVRARGRALSSEETELILENTGVAVDPANGENWFVPYASTNTSVNPSLGQGMGLGLPITRDLLAEYGGRIRFTEPAAGFSTAVQVVFVE
jgi:signal transduction histidine kinase